MLLAGESHAIVFCQLIRAIGKFLIGVSIRTVAADTRFVRRVLGRIVDKANEFVLDCDKGVLDHRIGFGEIGHKLVLEINISDVIGRLGPLHIKAAPGKLFKEQPVKSVLFRNRFPPFLITFSLHYIFENFNESKNALCRRLIFGVNRRQRRAPLFFQIVP